MTSLGHKDCITSNTLFTIIKIWELTFCLCTLGSRLAMPCLKGVPGLCRPPGLNWSARSWLERFWLRQGSFFLGRTHSLQLWGSGLGAKNVILLTWIVIISISLKSRFAIMCVNFKMSFVKLVGKYVDIVSNFLSTTTNSKSQAHSCTWGARNKSLKGNVL